MSEVSHKICREYAYRGKAEKAGRGSSGAPTRMRFPPGLSRLRYPRIGILLSLVVQMMRSSDRLYGSKSSSPPEWVAMNLVAPYVARFTLAHVDT